MSKITRFQNQIHSADTPDDKLSLMDTFDLSEYIPFQLFAAHVVTHSVIRPESHPDVKAHASLTKGDCRVLSLIATGIATGPSEITDILRIERAVTTRHLTNLEKQGLIRFGRSEKDLRRKKLFLTGLGEKVGLTVISIMNNLGEYLNSSISAKEQKLLKEILSKLHDSCENYPA